MEGLPQPGLPGLTLLLLSLPGLSLLLHTLQQVKLEGMSFLVISGSTGSEFKLLGENKFQVASFMHIYRYP